MLDDVRLAIQKKWSQFWNCQAPIRYHIQKLSKSMTRWHVICHIFCGSNVLTSPTSYEIISPWVFALRGAADVPHTGSCGKGPKEHGFCPSWVGYTSRRHSHVFSYWFSCRLIPVLGPCTPIVVRLQVHNSLRINSIFPNSHWSLAVFQPCDHFFTSRWNHHPMCWVGRWTLEKNEIHHKKYSSYPQVMLV